MNILHISDIHFRREYKESPKAYERMLSKMDNPLNALKLCINKALSENKVDLLIITGDLTEDGESEDYRILKEKVVEFTEGKIPVVVTLGNHDDKASFRKGWLGEAGSDEPYFDVYETNEFDIVSFDSSSSTNSSGNITEAHICWLKNTLEERKSKPVIIITHHHFDEKQAVIPCLKCENEFWDTLKKYNVIGIFNGHTHHHARGVFNDICYYTADGMSFCGENFSDGIVSFEETYGYSVYSIEKGIVKSTKIETISTGNVIDVCKGSDLI
ncbi:MAG: metallophosphoesterase [Tyzzerella sp.]|uniref:Metallophosphoesterase n=1 Tax=Candidatus Fimicola merdigallinarum TaxID=2840819 RepID=A0A9D9H2W5_9FIRM|nr:metallophosphoesterase [Candidatus Fimicola merdigallinarum]